MAVEVTQVSQTLIDQINHQSPLPMGISLKTYEFVQRARQLGTFDLLDEKGQMVVGQICEEGKMPRDLCETLGVSSRKSVVWLLKARLRQLHNSTVQIQGDYTLEEVLKWRDPTSEDYKELIKNERRSRWQKPEYKAHMSSVMANKIKDAEYMEQLKVASTRLWQTDEHRDKVAEGHKRHSEETRQHRMFGQMRRGQIAYEEILRRHLRGEVKGPYNLRNAIDRFSEYPYIKYSPPSLAAGKDYRDKGEKTLLEGIRLGEKSYQKLLDEATVSVFNNSFLSGCESDIRQEVLAYLGQTIASHPYSPVHRSLDYVSGIARRALKEFRMRLKDSETSLRVWRYATDNLLLGDIIKNGFLTHEEVARLWNHFEEHTGLVPDDLVERLSIASANAA